MRQNPPPASYKHIAVIFVVIALLLILGVVYLALSQVTITLESSNELSTNNFILTIAANPEQNTSTSVILPGQILNSEEKATGTFSVDAGKTVADNATGLVTLYNNRGTDQALVATTRLLTPAGVLFRLKNKINIPAGGTIEAEVYADVKGATGNIEPSKFTVPGLSETIQKLVYAESAEPMTGGTKQLGILTQADITKATTDLETKAAEAMLTKFIDQVENLTLLGTQIKSRDLTYDEDLLNTEIDSFELSGTIATVAVFADKETILDLAKNKLKDAKGPKGEFINIDPSSLTYELESINQDKQEAYLKVSISGLETISPDTDLFDKNLLVGFTEEDLRLYFSQFESIKNIQVKFSPFWVKKVPILKDHIHIEVAQ